MNHPSPKSYLKVHELDNVIIALQDLSTSSHISIAGRELVLPQDVKAKHKFVQEDLPENAEIVMYGVPVGKTIMSLPAGTIITTQNVKHKTSPVLDRNPKTNWNGPNITRWENRTFNGYHRSDGSVGTANIWLVFPLVFCENKNIEIIKEAVSEALGYSKYHMYKSFAKALVQGNDVDEFEIEEFIPSQPIFKNVDGVRFITHTMGCGGTRQDAQTFCGLMAGYLCNPNVAGATILSLGCQNAQYQILQEELSKRNPDFDKPIHYFDQQTIGTEEKLIHGAIKATIDGVKWANQQSRKPAPLSKLKIGLECGGSDGFSGISANPTLGQVSDIIAKLKGTCILAEFPELCGVEQELTDRCVNAELANKFLDLMHRYESAAIASGSSFDMNPSPGNIKDGLITDAMKSAGAAKKGGTSPVTDILDYPEMSIKSGLNLLNTPGNDVESTTALAGSGANIILFTTGLGTPTGNPIVPVIKVSSNSVLSSKMNDIIDIDTGPIISGEKSIEEMADELMELIIDIASGTKQSKAVINQQYDFIPWKRGVSL
ncbi:MAG: altronate dehydratase [Lewinellaceae bacterium]|nr:altronate dehydratase [Lewinellaceae bacterium]